VRERRGVTRTAQNLDASQAPMGWSFPWVAAAGSDFNLDFDEYE
jgi:predicted dithiol-disulfide oxidoreductase (DUF899 family)